MIVSGQPGGSPEPRKAFLFLLSHCVQSGSDVERRDSEFSPATFAGPSCRWCRGHSLKYLNASVLASIWHHQLIDQGTAPAVETGRNFARTLIVDDWPFAADFSDRWRFDKLRRPATNVGI